MSLHAFADALPDHAGDIRCNLDAILKEDGLSDQRKYGLLLACAHGSGYGPLVNAAESECEGKLTDEAALAARASAAVTTMNNVYYRFVHLASNPEYGQMPSKLRMSAIGSPGIEKEDFELFCLAVSVMNGCGMCVDSHEKVLKTNRVPTAAIQAAARIAAVMKAAASVHATL